MTYQGIMGHWYGPQQGLMGYLTFSTIHWFPAVYLSDMASMP